MDLTLIVSLFLLTTFTSTVAGICGLGGGLILAITLPWFVPAAAVIPIHGTTQLASNFTRLGFSFRSVYWPVVPLFIFGSLSGIAVFSVFLVNLSTELIPLFIAIYLLLSLWIKPIEKILAKLENFFIVGAVQTGLGLVVGAPGPLTMNLLLKRLTDKDQIIATAALLMGISNISKVLTYAGLGFIFFDYLPQIISAIIGASLGSLIGTRLRERIDNQKFMAGLKWLLTLLALQTLVRFSYG
ncbi:sulfite exporter TauE/SafE family protein [Shewanella eurypsychrophilus]|uniref:Probable membrane transporter protein n=1 Tax=Shewanella eurypsychrophilus TaxID=2593656 RepID=A0ABX6V9D7_9GAMM|nr:MULTISPECIES: sulfite exporter TauE/SafE family protein [Shewanella]QFU24075.1 TSUP family transporter [Shewanella sp. YLB-09]QPG59284.1 sulfite exporter TauE/SafE family protein [Shewanella eurypsychrophilus]